MQIKTPDIGVDKAVVAEILVKLATVLKLTTVSLCLSLIKQLLKCLALQQVS